MDTDYIANSKGIKNDFITKAVKSETGCSIFVILLHIIAKALFPNYYEDKFYHYNLAGAFLWSFGSILRKFYPATLDSILAFVFGFYSPVLLIYCPKLSIYCLGSNFFINFVIISLQSRIKSHILAILSNAIGWVACLLVYSNYTVEELAELTDTPANSGILAQFGIVLLFGYSIAIFVALGEKKEIENLESQQKQLIQMNSSMKKVNVELENALTEKENFILRFSHEIRNPLNCLLGNIELLAEVITEKSTKNMLLEAKICGEILLQLLNNILDTAKIASGRLDISLGPQNLKDFLERMWMVSSEIIRKKNLFGAVYLNQNIPEYLDMDSNRLMQIMMNMISNSAKFTEAGHVSVYIDFEKVQEIDTSLLKPRYFSSFLAKNSSIYGEIFQNHDISEKPSYIHEVITTRIKKFRRNVQIPGQNVISRVNTEQSIQIVNNKIHQATEIQMFITKMKSSVTEDEKNFKEDDGYIRIEFIDSGCGMQQDEINKIFKKFSQVNEASSKRQIGTGLGLWITHEIIELLGGKIHVKSVKDVGTCFVVMVKSKSRAPLSAVHSNNLHDYKNALVVEDIPYNKEINCKFLKKCGLNNIAVAGNGEEAVKIYKDRGPGFFDIILMDIDMPVMDGKIATATIRTLEEKFRWPLTKIIILTAYCEAKTRLECLEPTGKIKANYFLQKPTSYDELEKVLKRLKVIENFKYKEIQPRKPKKKVLLLTMTASTSKCYAI